MHAPCLKVKHGVHAAHTHSVTVHHTLCHEPDEEKPVQLLCDTPCVQHL